MIFKNIPHLEEHFKQADPRSSENHKRGKHTRKKKKTLKNEIPSHIIISSLEMSDMEKLQKAAVDPLSEEQI